MPPKKARESLVSNGGGEDTEATPAKQSKDGLSVEDLSLPKSMIARLAKGVLPPNTQIQKDALLALHKSATVFVSYLASKYVACPFDTIKLEAPGPEPVRLDHEITCLTQSNQKRTVHPPDVAAALNECELEGFLPRLEAELKKFTETQNDKRNNYRRKVKDQQKAAATGGAEGGDTSMVETADGANGTALNGEAADHPDVDRPSKKLKGEDGSAVAADEDEMDEDGDEAAQDDEPDDVDDAEDDLDEDGGDDEDEADDADEVEDDEGTEEIDADEDSRLTNMRDEALDDPGSDSD